MSMNVPAGLVIIEPLVQTPPEVTLANAGTDTQETGLNAQVILLSRKLCLVIITLVYCMNSVL